MTKSKLEDLCLIEKGKQIDTNLLDNSKAFRYINGGTKESGFYHDYNSSGPTITVSEGGASCGHVGYFDEKFWCGCHCYKLTRCKCKPKFLYYALKSNQQRIMDLRTGAAMPNIKKELFKKLELFVDNDVARQQTVIDNLDFLQQAIESKKNKLNELDISIKSRFNEMFVDKGFGVKPIRYFINKDKISAKKIYSESDYINYVDISSIDNSKNEIVSSTKYVFKDAPSRAQQCLKKKDILVSTVRPNLKNIALFDLSNDGYVGSSGFCVLRPVKCNPYYLKFVVLTDDFTDKMISLTTGASYPAIRDNDVFEYQMIDSPIDLQNEFGEFVEMIDKSKFYERSSAQCY